MRNVQERGEQRILPLHQKLAAAAIPADKQLYQRQTWRATASTTASTRGGAPLRVLVAGVAVSLPNARGHRPPD